MHPNVLKYPKSWGSSLSSDELHHLPTVKLRKIHCRPFPSCPPTLFLVILLPFLSGPPLLPLVLPGQGTPSKPQLHNCMVSSFNSLVIDNFHNLVPCEYFFHPPCFLCVSGLLEKSPLVMDSTGFFFTSSFTFSPSPPSLLLILDYSPFAGRGRGGVSLSSLLQFLFQFGLCFIQLLPVHQLCILVHHTTFTIITGRKPSFW